MFEVYTPKEWSSFFKSPCLIIDDNYLIWEADQYYKILFGEPSGRIDIATGKIYGKGLGYSLMQAPIGYIDEKNGVLEIRRSGGTWSSPILYIKDDKIYTPDRFYSIFDNPNGYINNPEKPTNYTQPSNSSSSSDSRGRSSVIDLGGIGFVLFMCAFLMIGNALETFVANPGMGLSILSLILLAPVKKKRAQAQPYKSNAELVRQSKQYALTMGLISLILPVVLTLCAKVNLALNFMLLPALFLDTAISCYFNRLVKLGTASQQPQQRTAYSTAKTSKWSAPRAPKWSPKRTASKTSKQPPEPTSTRTANASPKPSNGATTIAVCPHCGTKCRVPAGKGLIRIICPNQKCKVPFTFNS